MHDTLPLDRGGTAQTPQDYVEQVRPRPACRTCWCAATWRRSHGVLAEMENVLRGLTRGTRPRRCSTRASASGRPLPELLPARATRSGSCCRATRPGVHSLWVPAIGLKMPLVLKPGSAEPWTPYRIIQALIKAGAPAEAFSYYPTDHAGGAEILRSAAAAWCSATSLDEARGNRPARRSARTRLQQGRHRRRRRRQLGAYIDVIAASISDNAGRSCVNASGVWVTRARG